MKRHTKIIIVFWFVFALMGVATDHNEDRYDDFFYLNKEQEIRNVLQEMSYYRHLGLISQLDKDMGDTLQRTGSYYTLLFYLGATRDDLGRSLLKGFDQDLKALTASAGIYRRSNDPDYWGYDFRNCSRDQIFAAQAAIVAFRDFKRGRTLFLEFVKRGFLNQNTRNNWQYPWEKPFEWKAPDLPTPSQISLLLRGVGSSLLYPAIWVMDMFILIDVKFFRNQNERELWDYDIKQLPGLIAANSYLPTLWSRWGMKIYLQQKEDIQSRVHYYNLEKFNGIKPMADLYVLALSKLEGEDISDSSKNLPSVSQRFNRGPSSLQE